MTRYCAWAKDPFGAIKSISADTKEEAQKAAAEKGWNIVVGQFGSFPPKPPETITLPTGFTRETMPPTEHLRYLPETREYESSSGQRFSLEQGKWLLPLKPKATEEDVKNLIWLRYQREATPEDYATFVGKDLAETRKTILEAPEPKKPTELGLDIFKNFVKEAEKIKTDTWLIPEVKEEKIKELKTKTEQEFAQQISLKDFYDPAFQTQLQEMAKAGFSINEIKKLVEDRTKSDISSLIVKLESDFKPELFENFYEQYKSLALPKEVLKLYNDEITRLLELPNAYKEYYFGSSEKLGLIDKTKEKIKTRIEEIEKEKEERAKETTDYFNLEQQALLQKMNLQLAEVQENKEITKNFLTGKLAKLGALNTTGEAVNAIANLEMKYDKIYNTTKTSYELQLSTLSLKHQSALKELERAKTDAISKLKDKELEIEADITKEFVDKIEKINDKVFNLKEKYIKEEQDVSEKAIQFAIDLTKDYFRRLEEILTSKTTAIYLEKTLPQITKAKAEERALELALKRKSLATKDKTSAISLSEAKSWLAPWAYGMNEKEFLNKLALSMPPKEWLDFKGYRSDVSYLPTSPVVKEWQEDKKKSLKVVEPKPIEVEKWEIEREAIKSMNEQLLKVVEPNGYVSPENWKKALRAWLDEGLNATIFYNAFAIYVNPKKREQYGFKKE